MQPGLSLHFLVEDLTFEGVIVSPNGTEAIADIVVQVPEPP